MRNRKCIKDIRTNDDTVINGDENVQREVCANFKKRFRKELTNAMGK